MGESYRCTMSPITFDSHALFDRKDNTATTALTTLLHRVASSGGFNGGFNSNGCLSSALVIAHSLL